MPLSAERARAFEVVGKRAVIAAGSRNDSPLPAMDITLEICAIKMLFSCFVVTFPSGEQRRPNREMKNYLSQ
jgi:hypothetical protein